MKTVIGLVNNRANADKLVESIRRAGVPISAITVLLPGEHLNDRGLRNAAASTTGVASSAKTVVTGGAVGLVLGLGALAIPGFTPLILGGAGVTALAAVVTGGAVGALGALVGSSVPEPNIQHYEKRLHAGDCLVAARVANEQMATQLRGIFVEGGAEDIVVSAEHQPVLV
ncbi:hypothetical protein AYO41_03225 [Verrucomicrobia bacterium SCGC AG-212-E04]|nr:hypothetical protein AYO41_03225 [Verrucomicrobia bacterium SCGC AG-212-E04]